MSQQIELCDGNINSSDIDREDVCRMLPKRSTKILKIELKNGLKYVTLHTNCTTRDDIKSWISEYEDTTGATYSINKTRDCSGKYVIFKQFLNCHHKTRPRHNSVCGDSKSYTRNTNCPAAITVTLRSYKNVQKQKDLDRLEKAKLPCIFNLVLDHNHSTNASALKQRKVSVETREELIKLFQNGHSPATALQTIKNDIFLKDHSEKILADRKYCPDYGYCHRLYKKIFKEEYAIDLGATISSENGFKMIDHMTQTLRQTLRRFYVQSPEQLAPAIQKMTDNVKKLRSKASVVSACSNFANEKRPRRKTAQTAANGRKKMQRIEHFVVEDFTNCE